jgi:hemolysin D
VPDSRSKVVQPLEVAAVRAIHVRDGQAVKTDDLLIELDASTAQADRDRFAGEQRAAALDVVRYSALIDAQGQLKNQKLQSTKKIQPVLINLPNTLTEEEIAAENRWVKSLFEAYVTRLSQMQAGIFRREADYRATESAVEKYKETLPIIRQRAEDYSDLLIKKFIAKHEYLNLKAQLIEQEKDYITQQERLAEIAASRSEAEREREQFIAEQRREWLDKFHDAQQRESIVAQELIKAETRNRFMTLTAPVDGVVQQLAVHSLNGVVTPAQVLMVIVPQDNQIEVEAVLPNKDIGFVRVDQDVEVKLETFSFTKYGTVKGKVLSVSSDAIQDEKLGLVFSVRVGLQQSSIVVDGNNIRLSPGMAVSVEIKTTQRRVIEYFLDPLIRHSSESLRER